MQSTTFNKHIPLEDPSHVKALLSFWFDHTAGPKRWFKAKPDFDEDCRQWEPLVLSARKGSLSAWGQTPDGALVILILLDQIPRNIYRGTAQAFASDTQALELALHCIALGMDRQVPLQRQMFFYLPVLHQESLLAQICCVGLYEGLVSRTERGSDLRRHFEASLAVVLEHVGVIHRFGRYPTRNRALGRVDTCDELAYMENEASRKGL
ncbi:DUF924-domain-containing protein [Xylariaceae sp. FL1019]|nr:DUF924-domain-containing protein [Xylariaceae sp. FL1019]